MIVLGRTETRSRARGVSVRARVPQSGASLDASPHPSAVTFGGRSSHNQQVTTEVKP